MYSSSSVSTRFILIPILAVVATQLLLMRTVSSLNMTNAYMYHKCIVSQGKYKPGSWHEKELKNAIRRIASGDEFIIGYNYMLYKSNIKDREFLSVTSQYRCDSFGSKCRSCSATAVAGLRRRCPRYMGVIIWYDQCVLEITSIDRKQGEINIDYNFYMSNPKKMNVDSLGDKWMNFLDNLIRKTFKSRDLYAARIQGL